ncbi:MAG: hypothetical protein VX846_02950 [Actinomycetota bacterium]|nr:hypothetical protein [Actinomycetota bacterium]
MDGASGSTVMISMVVVVATVVEVAAGAVVLVVLVVLGVELLDVVVGRGVVVADVTALVTEGAVVAGGSGGSVVGLGTCDEVDGPGSTVVPPQPTMVIAANAAATTKPLDVRTRPRVPRNGVHRWTTLSENAGWPRETPGPTVSCIGAGLAQILINQVQRCCRHQLQERCLQRP